MPCSPRDSCLARATFPGAVVQDSSFPCGLPMPELRPVWLDPEEVQNLQRIADSFAAQVLDFWFEDIRSIIHRWDAAPVNAMQVTVNALFDFAGESRVAEKSHGILRALGMP